MVAQPAYDDLNAVFDVFAAYWIKAKRHESEGDKLFVRDEDIEKVKRDLLDQASQDD